MVWSDAELAAIAGDQELIWRKLQSAADSHDLLLGLCHVSHNCFVVFDSEAASRKFGDIPNGVCDCQHVGSCFGVTHSVWRTNRQRQEGQIVSLPIIPPSRLFEL